MLTAAFDARARRSDTPPPEPGKGVISTTRNRSRVTLPPVSFVTRRLTEGVPNVVLFAASIVNKSRALFGCAAAARVLILSMSVTCDLVCNGW